MRPSCPAWTPASGCPQPQEAGSAGQSTSIVGGSWGKRGLSPYPSEVPHRVNAPYWGPQELRTAGAISGLDLSTPGHTGLLFPRPDWLPLSESKKGDGRDAGGLCSCCSQLPRAGPHLRNGGPLRGTQRQSSPRVPGSQLWGWVSGVHPVSQSFSSLSLFPFCIKKKKKNPKQNHKNPRRDPLQKLNPLTEAADCTTRVSQRASPPLPAPLPPRNL